MTFVFVICIEPHELQRTTRMIETNFAGEEFVQLIVRVTVRVKIDACQMIFTRVNIHDGGGWGGMRCSVILSASLVCALYTTLQVSQNQNARPFLC